MRSRSLHPLWLTCLLALLVGGSLCAQADGEAALRECNQASDRGDWTLVRARLPLVQSRLSSPISQAEALTLWAHACRRTGDPDSALLLHRAAYQLRRDYCGAESPEAGQSLHNLGNGHLRLGEWSTSARYLYQAYGLFRAAREDSLLAKVANSLGVWHLQQRHLDSSRHYFDLSLSAWETALGGGSPRLLAPLVNTAAVLEGRNDELALPYLWRAQALADGAGAEERAQLSDNLGRTYLRLHRLDSAQHYLQRAIDGYEALPEPPRAALSDAYLALGTSWLEGGEPGLAMTVLEQGISLGLAREGDASLSVSSARLLQARARCHLVLGERAAAEADLLDAVSTLQSAGERATDQDFAEAYAYLGRYHLEVDDWDAADYYLEAALDRWAALGDRYGYSRTLAATARLRFARGDWPAVLAILADVEAAGVELSEAERLDLSLLRADTHWEMKNLNAAHEGYQAVVSRIGRDTALAGVYALPSARAYLGLARVAWARTDSPGEQQRAAYDHARQSAAWFTRLINETSDEQGTLLARYRFDELFDYLVRAALALGQAHEAFYWAEYSKVLTLRRLQGRSPERLQLRQRLAYWRLQLQEVGHAEPRRRVRVARIRDSIYRISRALVSTAQDQVLQSPPTVPELQAGLSPQQSLLSYYWGSGLGYGFLLRPDTLLVFPLPLGPALEERVRRYFQLVGTSPWVWPDAEQDARLAECWDLSHQLYQTFWAPAEPFLTRSVLLIPDGLLHYLPFPALLRHPPSVGKPRAEDYVLGNHDIQLHFSAALLERRPALATGEREPDQLLGFAPTFAGDPTGLPPLYYNLREVDVLRKRYRGHYFMEGRGTKSAFSAQRDHGSVWHFSTHGYYDDARPEASFLAFTYAGERPTDNRLFAAEIAAMDLQPKLVVLSACETAAGTLYRGEGLLSLTRSFYQAGARNIIATRWRIDDAQSARLMAIFYDGLEAGLPSSAALKRAQERYLAESSGPALHPYYWAAFLHLGEGAAVALQPARRISAWTWGGVGLLLLAGGWIIGKRRHSAPGSARG